MEVKIIEFEETKVAALEHHGDPQLIQNSIEKFIDWRKQHQLSPNTSATFNILYNNPAEVAPENYRLDLCVEFQGDVARNSIGMVQKVIPAGRCAVLRHIGSDDLLANAIEYLYAEWLPQSGEASRDFPVFLQRVLFIPDVAETEATTDIFMPLQ